MRKTRFLVCMLVGYLLLSLPAYAQEPVINFSQRQMTLSQALAAVEQQSGYSIAYNENLLDLRKVVSTPSGKTLSELLPILLDGSNAEARISGKMILIVEKEKERPRSSTYTGVVVDKDGPLVGALVQVLGMQSAVTTSIDGTFSIPAEKGSKIVVRMLGYKDASFTAGNRTDGLTIVMTEDTILLEEAVVVGYGTMQRRDITSAISTYKPADEGERQVLSPDAMLQGRIAGVNVTAASGTPGGKSRVSIRGIGSLTAGNEPLYVIDGIPMSNTSGDTGAWGGESLTGLSDINPADIESVQVLKDAASAAIYGSRGTNGVIIITTKKGAKGAPKLSADASFGLSWLANLDKLKVADADLYLEVQNEAIDNYNIQTGSSIARLENPYPGKPQFSWLDMVFRVAKSWNAAVSVSGGSENANYYISANAKQNEGVGIGSLYEKYTLKTNVNSDVRKWLSVGAAMNFSYTNANRVPDGSIGTSMLTHGLEHRPWDTPFKPDGSYTIINAELLHYNLVQAINEQHVYNRSYRMYGSAYMKLNFSKDLNFKTSFGGDIMAAEDHVQYTSEHMYGNSVGVLIDSRKNFTSIVVDNVLSYNHKFGKLTLDAMLGHSFQMDNNSTALQKGQGFPSKSFDVNSVAAEFTDVTSGLSTWALQSFMHRTTLNWENRYLITVNARFDGSSKFAPEHRYGFFPSVSLGWNMSEEPFWQWKDTKAKLRASYGATGNQGGIGSYAYQSLANGGYNYMNRNGLAGVDVEMAEAIAEELKRPIQFRIVPFSEILPLVINGAADMGTSGISITPERTSMILFSNSYENSTRRILVKEGSKLSRISDLDGKVVGAEKGTTNEEYAVNKLHAKKTVHYDNAEEGIRGLLNNEIDAYVDDESEVEFAMEKHKGQVKMMQVAIRAEEYGFAFRLGNTEAKAAADRVIEAKRRNGDLQALFRKYTSIYKTLGLDGI